MEEENRKHRMGLRGGKGIRRMQEDRKYEERKMEDEGKGG